MGEPSLIRHVQFVRDHQRKVNRIALAVDGALVGLAPRIGEHFTRAEVRAFAGNQLEAAVTWGGRWRGAAKAAAS